MVFYLVNHIAVFKIMIKSAKKSLESYNMALIVAVSWALLALIHILPAIAFFRPSLISKLYALEADSPLFALMHHRAALFIIVFAIAILAVINIPIRPIACSVLGFSMLSFIYIYHKNGKPMQLEKIYKADIIGLLPLLVVCFDAIGFI